MTVLWPGGSCCGLVGGVGLDDIAMAWCWGLRPGGSPALGPGGSPALGSESHCRSLCLMNFKRWQIY